MTDFFLITVWHFFNGGNEKKKIMAQFTLFDMRLIGSFLNMENTTLSGINIDPLFPIQLSLPSPPAK